MSITQARTLIVKHHKYAWILTLSAVLVISGVYFRDTVTHAATYYFQQSSWSGGTSVSTATHSSNQDSGWNTYDSASSTLVIGDNITLVPTTPTFTDDGTTSTNSQSATGGDFDNGTVSNTAVVGTGADALIKMGVNISEISAGSLHACALATEGTVYCWGFNNSGQLGDNTTTSTRTPVQVKGVGGSGYLTSVAKISVGGSHSCAVKTDGTAYCWGFGNYGVLGQNSQTSYYTPVQVKGVGGSGYLIGVAQISAGLQHTCAVKTDGTAYCWGRNAKGNLGDNTTTNRWTPVQVLGVGASGYLTGVEKITLGSYYDSGIENNYDSTCAVKNDGTAYCWGYNNFRQLGDNTTTQRNTPVQVLSVGGSGYLTDVAEISIDGGFACASKTDGTAYCWGYNGYGQLGDNTVTNRNTPVQVLGVSGSGTLTGVTKIKTLIMGSVCALKDGATLYCWGNNSQGQLGDNTVTQRKTPVQVVGVGGTGYLTGVVDISKQIGNGYYGGGYFCATASGGSAYCWGDNGFGQLGDNTITQRNAPIQVHGVGDSGYLNLLNYGSSGTFTSAVIDMGGLAGFTTIGFGSSLPANTSINVDVRAGNTSSPDGTWEAWQTGLASGGSIEIFSGKRYIQYRANLATSNTSATPTFDYLTINYTEYTPIGSLVSSAYNSESNANIMGGLIWAEDATLPFGTEATFYVRTSATSDFSASSWSTAINSSTTGCSKVGTTVTCTTDAIDAALRDGLNDQWFQYKVTLTSLGANTPTIDDVRVAYVVNGPPTFDTTYSATGVITTQNTTVGDADYGKVNISYRVGDIDTASFTPSFKYSVNGGSSWSDIPSDDLSADATSLKTYTGGATTTFSVVWNATSTLSANPVNVANAKVRVTANDGDVANNIGIADSAEFTLDTTYPEITSGNFVVDSSVDGAGSAGTPGDNRAGIKLYATDYSTIQYRLCNNSAFPTTDSQGNSCAWSSLAASPISLATSSTQWITTGYPSAETVYVQVRDAYGNVTSGTASAPAMPANFDYKDVSNTDIDVYREFLSWSLFSATDSSTFTGNSSGRYKLHHAAAADGSPAPASSAYSVVTSISDPSINYTTHNITSATTSVHYYKVTAVNDQGSISDFTAVLSDIPNGSGGAVSLPPQITDTPTADTIRNTSAHITFTTDSLATSTIEYGTTNSYGSTANQTSFVENHSVYLNSLSPNTAYYFRAKATNAEGLDSDWAVGTTFTTAQGTVISGVTPMNVTDKTATIFWNTNASSTSKVYYGTDRSGSTLVGSVTVTGTSATTAGTNGLFQHQVGIPSSGAFTAGNTYYYKVESTDGDGNTTTDDNNGQFYSFTTTLDTTAPTISNISAAVVGPTSAVIVWTTDEPATSQVRWSGATGNHSKRTTTDMTFAGIPSYSVYHVATLSSQTQNIGDGGGTNVLVAQTPYYYTVVSADAATNETESAEQTFTTTRTGEDVVVTVSRSLPQGEEGSGPTADTASPVIKNMKVSDITPFTAMVTFDTSEGAVGKLAYSKDTSYGDHAADDFSWGTKHSIKLRGLTLGTQYHIKAAVVDKAGNTGYSEEQTFKTSFLSENVKELSKIENIEQFQKEIEETIESILPSLIPPFVSKPAITNITESGATISFRTNIKAFPLVGFVEDSTYNVSKENPYASEVSDTTAKATNHTLALLNLKPNTKYHVQARAFSLPQVVGKSEDLTFTTQASKIQSSIVETKRDSFTVVWITDEPTTSIVEYKDLSSGITQRKADDRKTTSHSVKIENLPSGTSFDVNVSGLNEGGNLIEGGSTLRVTTSRDVAPPTISNFKVSNAMVPGRTDRIQTIISWTTNEPADSVVYYEEGIGTTGGEEKELANKSEVLDAYVMDHNIIISSLKPGAIYRVKVTSVDESGNLGVFGPRTIITPKQTESITDIIFKNFEDSFKFMRDI